MSIVPDGYVTFREATGIVSTWLRRRALVNFTDEAHRAAECENQLHHALLAGDIHAWAFDANVGVGRINSQYWLDGDSFQTALNSNVGDHPRYFHKKWQRAHPVYISKSDIEANFLGNKISRRAERRKPYRLLRDGEWGTSTANDEPPTNTVAKVAAKAPSLSAFREKYRQRLDSFIKAGKQATRDEDRAWAKSTFGDFSGVVTLADQVRGELIPDEWKRAGRPIAKN